MDYFKLFEDGLSFHAFISIVEFLTKIEFSREEGALRPSPQKKSIFIKKLEIEINV
jgi:hypothetical protein